jgi:peptide/nickel transport system permease protein
MSMRRYVVVRTAWSTGVLFTFVSLAYLFVWVFWAGRGPRPHLSYGSFLENLVHGSLGRSVDRRLPGAPEGRSVGWIVWHAMTPTLSLLLVAALLTVVIAVPLALLYPRARRSVRGFEYLGVSLQPIWVGLMLLYLAFKVGLNPVTGYCSIGASPITSCHGPVRWISHLLLPGLALALFFSAIYCRHLRHALDEARTDYRERTRNREEPEAVRRDLRRVYGLSFAKLLGRDFGVALGLATFIEMSFGIPGLGRTFFQALPFNPPVGAGVLVWAATLAALVNLTVDLACAAADTRFRRF